jgi:type I restriction enzyme R subunit
MLESRIKEMEVMDMAVVVSQGQNEQEDLAAKGLDIVPHRKRILEEDLDEKFKSPDDPLRLVFVCAMWITGFDVPSCSTLYLDKPMRNHTLMQTIARANRKYPGKQAGLIVDYVGVFRNLQKALAIYGSPTAGDGGDTPIKSKDKLLDFLKGFLVELTAFCKSHGVDCGKIKTAPGFQKIQLLDEAVEALIETEETKNTFISKVTTACRVYRAILPDTMASQVAPDVTLFSVLAQKIRGLVPPADISHIMDQVEDILDRSVAADPYVMPAGGDKQPLVDLSKIDFDKLRETFTQGRKRTEAEKLRALISEKLNAMMARNKMRADFLERFQKLIDSYNSGSKSIEAFFAQLIDFAQNLNEEEQRAMREGLTEEELAMFDILTKPEPKLSKKEEAEVKKVCKELLAKLKKEKLVLDWRNRQRARAAVKQTVKIVLDALPRVYTTTLYEQKCDLAFRHVYDSYAGGGESVYRASA